ncbi:MAG: tryptophan-rich sensory protein [Caldilineaceae bacterium]|nr:tryptophan-rich sensory protein [Caldilineaceae bacterium]
MNRDLLRQILVLVTFIATVAVNGYASAAEIGGRSTGEISDSFQNFFTPAGYVFSIWGVIYLGLLAFSIYQLLPAQREDGRLRRIGWLFILTNLFNGAWIFAWHYLLIPLSWLIMIGLLITLLIIYQRLGIGKRPASGAQLWMVNVPFSIYTAWITVATIANTTVLLQDLGFEGGPIPEPIWSAIVIVVGAAIAGYVVYTRRDIAFTGVILWAYAGIVVNYFDVNTVAITAGLMAVAVLIALIIGWFRNQPPQQDWRSQTA